MRRVPLAARLWQSNPFPGDNRAYADIANGMVFLQTASAPVQFVMQAGILRDPDAGRALHAGERSQWVAMWGPVPQAYVKLVPADLVDPDRPPALAAGRGGGLHVPERQYRARSPDEPGKHDQPGRRECHT